MYELENHHDNTGRYVFYAWGPDGPEPVEKALRHPRTKEITIVGPEEWEPVLLGGDRDTVDETLKFAARKNIKLNAYYGAVMDKQLNTRYQHIDFNIKHWPNYFGHRIAYRSKFGIYPQKPEADILKKHFVSMNGRPHWWRCMFIDKLFGKGLFDYGYISWHEFDYEDYHTLWDFEYWEPKNLEFDSDFKQDNGMCDIFVPPKEFKNSVFSIISESNLNCLFLTEKTYMAIYHTRPFIVWCVPCTHRYLKNIGFKLFDNVIDYKFDKIEDDEKRCEMFIQQVHDFCLIDKQELHKLTKDAAEYNFEVFLDHLKTKKFVPEGFEKFCIENIDNPKQLLTYLECVNSYEPLMEFLKS